MKKSVADTHLTKAQFKKLSWEEMWKRAIAVDRDEFIRNHKRGKA